MRVVVKVSPDIAAALDDPSRGALDAESVIEAVRASGSALEEMHPGQHDPSLTGWYLAEVDSEDVAVDLAGALAAVAGVEAAYMESEATPP